MPTHPKPIPLKNKLYSLTKTKYGHGLQCLKLLHLELYAKDLADPIDAGAQRLFDQGHEVGEFAQRQYPKGLLVVAGHDDPQGALDETRQAMFTGAPALFEAAFLFEDILVRVDILARTDDGQWDLIEVKSSTHAKPEHLPDLAIQRFVLEGAGISIRRSILMYLNRACVHPDLHDLFTRHDLTREVAAEMTTVPNHLARMRRAIAEDRPPAINIGPHCDKPHTCSFKGHCWTHIPEHSVFELGGVWAQTKFDLYSRGTLNIADIPETHNVLRANPAQLIAVRTGRPVVAEAALREFLARIRFPAYFLDFETIGFAVPRFEGTHPYDQIPFQFSLHVLDHPSATPRQIEFLATDAADPRAALTQALCDAIGPTGTVVAYHQSFEKKRIEELAEALPRFEPALRAMLDRFVDLEEAFKKHYYHPDFHGSSSIKATLPALVPSMRYDDLQVRDGIAAQSAYLKMVDPRTPPDEAAEQARALREYCGQDSLAMVELWRFLVEVLSPRAA